MANKTFTIIALKGNDKIYCDDCSKSLDNQADLTPIIKDDTANDEAIICVKCGKLLYP